MATFPVTAGADDYYSSPPSFFDPNLAAIRPGGSAVVPVRAGAVFRNVTIAPGATVTSAFVRFIGNATFTHDGAVAVGLEDADNPTNPTSRADAAARVMTTATATWTAASPVAGVAIDTPDLTAVVQEVIDRPGWASGNNMHLMIDRISGNTDFQLASWDHGTYEEPVLHINADPPDIRYAYLTQ